MELKEKSLGEKLSPILVEIEETLWERAYYTPHIPEDFDDDGFRAGCKIFMSVMLDYFHKHTMKMPEKEKLEMVEALGHRIRHLVFEFTGKNTLEFYK